MHRDSKYLYFSLRELQMREHFRHTNKNTRKLIIREADNTVNLPVITRFRAFAQGWLRSSRHKTREHIIWK